MHYLDLIFYAAAIAAPIYALVMLLALGLCRSAAEGDAAMLDYLEAEHGFEPYDHARADAETDGRAWIARVREAS